MHDEPVQTTVDDRSPRKRRVWALLGVILALAWPFRTLLFERRNHLLSSNDDIRTIIAEWLVVLVLAWIAFGLQRKRPEFFGLRMFGWRDFLYMLGALVGVFVLSAALSAFVTAPKVNLHQFTATPVALRVLLVLTAAICEEFIYRGFAIEQIGELTGSRWLGAFLSLFFFGLGHIGLYGFSTALLIPTSVGLMITLLYMFRRNLPICMLMHGIMDTLFVIVIPALLKAR